MAWKISNALSAAAAALPKTWRQSLTRAADNDFGLSAGVSGLPVPLPLSIPGRQAASGRVQQEDIRRIFVGDTHWTCLDSVVRSLLDGKGLTTIVGEPGVGKTTLLNATMIRLCRHPFRFVRMAGPSLRNLDRDSWEKLVSAALFSPGSENLLHPPDEPANQGLREHVRICLAIDEAEVLSSASLHFLLQLAENLAGNEAAPMLLLVGRPAFGRLLADCASICLERLSRNHLLLAPLSDDGAVRYVEHLFESAGASAERMLARTALPAIIQHGRGNPRRINSLVVTSLELACVANQKMTRRTVERAAARLGDGTTASTAARLMTTAQLGGGLGQSWPDPLGLTRPSRAPRSQAKPAQPAVADGAPLVRKGGQARMKIFRGVRAPG